ncbi:hypothetical protein DL98DRAFT_596554 [Cadophora sp. DSE1049]|nr:hypothetical protein DL98DRAFT_596554 [Cadophora sp. DSE1049]
MRRDHIWAPSRADPNNVLQTISSIVSPSQKSGVVGCKPTRGLIPAQGIITVSQKKDVVGPIVRTVKDAALILDAITPVRHAAGLYAKSCSTTDLRADAFQVTVDLLKAAGAIIVDDIRLAGLDDYISLPDSMRQIVLDTEFKVSMEKYFHSLLRNSRSPFKKCCHHATSTTYGCQRVKISGDARKTANSLRWEEIRSSVFQWGEKPEGTEMKRDPQSGFVTAAPGVPFSLFLCGKRFDEQGLFRVAYAFEQLTQARMKGKPYLVPKLDLKDFIELSRPRAKL